MYGYAAALTDSQRRGRGVGFVGGRRAEVKGGVVDVSTADGGFYLLKNWWAIYLRLCD